MTGAEWAPEHEVDEAPASALIERAAPQLRGARVRRLAAGWDNTVFVVEGRRGLLTESLAGLRRALER